MSQLPLVVCHLQARYDMYTVYCVYIYIFIHTFTACDERTVHCHGGRSKHKVAPLQRKCPEWRLAWAGNSMEIFVSVFWESPKPYNSMLPWEPQTFTFRGYNPYIGGLKPSFFMVLGCGFLDISFKFSPLLGEMIPIEDHIFQMGWLKLP